MTFVANTKDYSKFHKVTLGTEQYIFDPYQNGIGMWKELTASGKAGKIVTRDLQRKLNELVFGNPDLPNMVERFKYASASEKEILTDVAISWLQLKIKGIKENSTMENVETKNVFMMGRMYFYIYDAKWKDILPVWDRFPLMIPIKNFNNGVLGLNFHFLDSGRRAVVLDELQRSYGSLDKDMKLSITYDDVSRLTGIQHRNKSKISSIESIASMPELKPCVKRYLYSHVRSRLLVIEPHEWAYAIWLPAEEFVYLNKTRKKGVI